MDKRLKEKFNLLTEEQQSKAKLIKNKKYFSNYVLKAYEKNNKNPQLMKERKAVLKNKKQLNKIVAITVSATLAFGVVLGTFLGVKSCIQNQTDITQPFNGGNLNVILQGDNHILVERKPGTTKYKVITTVTFDDGSSDVRTFTVDNVDKQAASMLIGDKEYDQLETNKYATQLSKVNVVAYNKSGKVIGKGTGNYKKEATLGN